MVMRTHRELRSGLRAVSRESKGLVRLGVDDEELLLDAVPRLLIELGVVDRVAPRAVAVLGSHSLRRLGLAHDQKVR